MGDVEYHRAAVLLHLGYAAVVHDKVLVAEGGAALGYRNLRVACLAHFLHGVCHGSGRQELSFLDVYHLSGACRRHKQVGLTAEEGRNLKHVDKLGGHGGLWSRVDVGHNGYAVSVADFFKDVQRFKVADPCKGVEARAVGLAIGAFEHIGYAQAVGDLLYAAGYVESHLLPLYGTWAGKEEEVAAGGGGQVFCQVYIHSRITVLQYF